MLKPFFEETDLRPSPSEPFLSIKEDSTSMGLFGFIYRMVCLWFISSALVCLLVSIPISLLGLPIVLSLSVTVGVVGLVLTFIARTYVKLVLGLYHNFKRLMLSPFKLIDSWTSSISKVLWSPLAIFKSTKREPVDPQRLQYLEATYGSDELRSILPPKTQDLSPTPVYEPIEREMLPSLSNETLVDRTILENVNFRQLSQHDLTRLQLCTELFSQITITCTSAQMRMPHTLFSQSGTNLLISQMDNHNCTN
ncbi:hypothetical protein EDD86DRAFT_215462 [Gorgonomyces haynaldii]|nr:hypothetical protein EDD86DRAFT_215462 [Gorgonomyces haynaldii]